MKIRTGCTLRVWLFAALLLTAQWLVLQHEVQIEAHQAHTSCEWCLGHAPLTGTAPHGLPVLGNAPLVDLPAACRDSFVLRTVHAFYTSRAPPRSLVV